MDLDLSLKLLIKYYLITIFLSLLIHKIKRNMFMPEEKKNDIDFPLYENLNISEEEIEKIITIFESLTDDQKNMAYFYYHFQPTMESLIIYFEDEEYINEELGIIHRKFSACDPTSIKEVLNIYIPTSRSNEHPISKKKSFLEKLNDVHNVFPWIKYTAIAFFSFACITLSLTTVKGLYQLGIIQVAYEKSSDISVNSETKYELNVVENLYLPEYLPEGYNLIEQLGAAQYDPSIDVFYSNGIYELQYRQSIENNTMDLDNEIGISKELDLNGKNGLYKQTNESKLLLWSEKEYFFSLYIYDPNINEKELLKIAKSIKESKQ